MVFNQGSTVPSFWYWGLPGAFLLFSPLEPVIFHLLFLQVNKLEVPRVEGDEKAGQANEDHPFSETIFIIDCEAREIVHMVAPVRLSVHLFALTRLNRWTYYQSKVFFPNQWAYADNHANVVDQLLILLSISPF